jgi:hypothetical protein
LLSDFLVIPEDELLGLVHEMENLMCAAGNIENYIRKLASHQQEEKKSRAKKKAKIVLLFS